MSLRTKLGLVLVAAAAVTLVACKAKDGTSSLSVAGSTSVQPFMELLAEDYMAHQPGVKIQVQGGGSTAGIQAVREHAAAIGMCSRELLPQEKDLKSVVIARDGIAVIVNPANTLSGLTTAQVKDIFAGSTSDFSAVGGGKSPVRAVTREEGSGTRGAFEELVMAGTPIASSALVQNSSGSVRAMVSRDPGAIGYISLGLVDDSVKALAIDGVAAKRDNVKNGTYKLVRPFLLVYVGELQGTAKEFVDYILGEPAQRLLEKEGLVAVK